MLMPVTYNVLQDRVELIDQTRLPIAEERLDCHSSHQIVDAVKTMKVRGAPAIGVAAGFGMYLGLKEFAGNEDKLLEHVAEVRKSLAETRPTAVNLFWALERMDRAISRTYKRHAAGERLAACRKEALHEAKEILNEDVEMCRIIGCHGAEFLQDGQTWLTHCNAGALATGGYGTALGVFRAAKEKGRRFSVFVDETRPLLQGARLTAWELQQEGISATLICDSMAGSLMAAGRIHGVVVGADRITTEGFVANKIGTYSIAVLAHHHKIPFYVAAPVSTFDLTRCKGSEITIEERSSSEITHIGGVQLAPEGMKTFNPAFDVTPPELIAAIFTNLGVLRSSYKSSIRKLLKEYFPKASR